MCFEIHGNTKYKKIVSDEKNIIFAGRLIEDLLKLITTN
jgi:hypothetical protein